MFVLKMSINKAEIELIKIIGQRLAAARDLCRFTIKEAAPMLGVTPLLLGKIEKGTNIKFIPQTLIYKASTVYGVSIDFLYGTTEDWELDPIVQGERLFGVGLYGFYTAQLSKLSVRIAEQHRKQQALVKATKLMIFATDELDKAMTVFKQMNKFDDLPCGARLDYRTKKLIETTNTARRELVRCKAIFFSFLPTVSDK